MANGLKINNKAMENKNGLMAQNILVNTTTGRKTEKVSSHGPMGVVMRVHFNAIIYKDTENIFGETVNHTKDNGITTK